MSTTSWTSHSPSMPAGAYLGIRVERTTHLEHFGKVGLKVGLADLLEPQSDPPSMLDRQRRPGVGQKAPALVPCRLDSLYRVASDGLGSRRLSRTWSKLCFSLHVPMIPLSAIANDGGAYPPPFIVTALAVTALAVTASAVTASAVTLDLRQVALPDRGEHLAVARAGIVGIGPRPGMERPIPKVQCHFGIDTPTQVQAMVIVLGSSQDQLGHRYVPTIEVDPPVAVLKPALFQLVSAHLDIGQCLRIDQPLQAPDLSHQVSPKLGSVIVGVVKGQMLALPIDGPILGRERIARLGQDRRLGRESSHDQLDRLGRLGLSHAIRTPIPAL